MSEKPEKDAVEVGLGCLWSMATLFVQIALLPWAAFVLTTIWRWFAVEKLGAQPIPFAVMGGLMVGSSLLRLTAHHNENNKVTMTTTITGFLIVPALILGIARVWLVFA